MSSSETIKVVGAQATCIDCGKQVESGTLEINLDDWCDVTALATGDLFRKCADHHDRYRKWGREDLPQHSVFIITQGEANIGSFRTSSMASEVGIKVNNQEIQNQLSEQARVIRDLNRRMLRR